MIVFEIGQQTVLYQGAGLDITQDVLELANSRYAEAGKNAAAAPAGE